MKNGSDNHAVLCYNIERNYSMLNKDDDIAFDNTCDLVLLVMKNVVEVSLYGEEKETETAAHR